MKELELTSLLFRLADIGITGIKVHYDGGGDSGAIEWIGYTKEPCATPEDINNYIDNWDNDSNLAELDSALYALVEEFSEDKILNDIEDWWNNEGGFGDLCICIPSGKYIIDNSIRITETEEFLHEGSLLEKAED
jgi:hypothetical protein